MAKKPLKMDTIGHIISVRDFGVPGVGEIILGGDIQHKKGFTYKIQAGLVLTLMQDRCQ